MRRSVIAALSVALLAVLVGCSPTVSMAPAADDANDPGCAEVTSRLYYGSEPVAIGDYALRSTDAQGTAAWGTPTTVLLYCGVPVVEVSELPCIEYNGVFWLREELDAGYAFTTYGREPAVRLVVGSDFNQSPGVAIDELTDIIALLPENGRVCLETDETVTGQSVDDADE
jgi:hypothetical protein